MFIERIIFPVTALGPGKRIGLWTRGCFRNCPNCISEELKNFSEEHNQDVFEIISNIDSIINTQSVSGITISGGEPFLQKEDLYTIIKHLVDKGINDILIYTGYTLLELKNLNDEYINNILANIAVLIDGEYIDELNTDLILRGSSNQMITVLNESYHLIYDEYLAKPKSFQIINQGKDVSIIGIPRKRENK